MPFVFLNKFLFFCVYPFLCVVFRLKTSDVYPIILVGVEICIRESLYTISVDGQRSAGGKIVLVK